MTPPPPSADDLRQLRPARLWTRLGRQVLGDVLRGDASLGGLLGRPRQRVFCIGRNKTGTTSVKAAFEAFGYNVAPQPMAEMLLRDWSRGDFRRLIMYCRAYDAFQDVPFSYPGTFRVLDEALPNSKFVLTVRDSPDQWYQSAIRFYTKMFGEDGRVPTPADLKRAPYRYPGFMWDDAALCYGVDESSLYDPYVYKNHYQQYNESVLSYFKGKPRKLLVLNVAESGSYEKLAEFLGESVDSGAKFPWKNKT